jgi:polyhydroxyalkanoate synthase
MATPVDFTQLGPLGDVFSTTSLDVESILGDDGNVPPRVMLQAFRSLTPMAEVTQYVNLWERLWNDEYVTADKHELRLDGGHIGLVAGRTAEETTIPTIIGFLRQRSEPQP